MAEIQKKGGTERGDGGREGGEEQELAASCKEQTGKALMDSDDERFLQALTSFSELLLHFTLLKTTKYMFFLKTQVNKDEGDTGWEMTAEDILTATEGSGFKAHCCRLSLGLQSKASTPSVKN